MQLQDALSLALLLIIAGAIATAYFYFRRSQRKSLPFQLRQHFRHQRLEQLTVSERQFPAHIRADLQRALDEFLTKVEVHSFFGVYTEMGFGGVDFNNLLKEDLIDFHGAAKAGPPQYEQIDIGETEPLPVLKSGLWFLSQGSNRFALLFSGMLDNHCGGNQHVRIQIATLRDPAGTTIARDLFQHFEAAVARAKSYRGKILSLEQASEYSGQSSGVKVHRLSRLEREQVILPPATLELLERNVTQFVQQRSELKRLQMAVKKGLLFYGPPGTGKTHTIRYLAGSLPEHTTLLIAAEQVGLIGEYLTLARLLQPSIVVIEDVDLIARERTRMRNAGTELLLNKLLNEMDGLREDCEILFILTTNRPEELEQALASRPGRIDQAIEFPLPDAAGRAKLVKLYSRGIETPADVVQDVVTRTERVSASFIKELMRRAAQFHLRNNGTQSLSREDISQALDEMLFSGGSLNLKLLGAAGKIDDAGEA
jgi:cell division protease FtsH